MSNTEVIESLNYLIMFALPYQVKGITVQAHKTSRFYVGIMLKLRLNIPVVRLHGISIGGFLNNGIRNPTKVAEPNGC